MLRRSLTLVTARTRLDPLDERDASQLLTLFRDPMVRRYLLDDQVVSAEWLRDEIAASKARFAGPGTGMWAVRLTTGNAPVGVVGFREFGEPPQLQLLYALGPEVWGAGLATEAAAAVCDWAFRVLELPMISAATDIENAASARVLRRLGMRQVRISPEGAGGTASYVLERERWLTAHEGLPSPPR
jgi:ribosomal-protein-alanine N-acetyltransferase